MFLCPYTHPHVSRASSLPFGTVEGRRRSTWDLIPVPVSGCAHAYIGIFFLLRNVAHTRIGLSPDLHPLYVRSVTAPTLVQNPTEP